MIITRPVAALCAISALSSLAISNTPAVAATPKAPPKPALTCKVNTPEGLSYTVIKAGKGEKPGADAKVEVNYSGRLKADGSEFDSGRATKFKVGGVIPGFAQGLKLMQPGGTYRFCIPAALGYGDAGKGSIPANADLVFEVDLLSFTNPPPRPVIPAEARGCDLKSASGLAYAIAKQGSGRAPTPSDMILIDIVTFDAATGVVTRREDWVKVPMSQVTPDFAEVLGLMQAGASFRLCIPAEGPPGEPAASQQYDAIDLIDVRAEPADDD
jgi:FKBP-type peptidyl-prolyl cis-trans isomerase